MRADEEGGSVQRASGGVDTPLIHDDNIDDDVVHVQHTKLLEQPAMPSVILVTIPLFMGYASLVSFQADIKDAIGITDETSGDSYAFGEAVSLLFLAALIFRLCHNIFLAFLKPRHRVILACLMMSASLGVVAIVFYALRWKNIALVFVVYFFGGMAVGTFEANFVSCVTPLGHQSKKWAVMGMPVGYNGVSIGGFALFALFPKIVYLQGLVFGVIALACCCGMLFFIAKIPAVEFEASGVQSVGALVAAVRQWRAWVPLLRYNIIAFAFDMFCCILAGSIVLYVFKVDRVPLVPGSTVTLPYNAFQAIFNICAFIGDFSARKIVYAPPQWWPTWALGCNGNPLRFSVLTLIGAALSLARVAILAPIGMFLIMLGNGMIYATSTKHIDENVEWRYNLIGVSFWLFVGDCGSYLASTLTTPVSNALGRISS